MTSPILVDIPVITTIVPKGVAFAVFPSDITMYTEIQRAPDDGGGNPDVANAEIIRRFTPRKMVVFQDFLPLDGAPRYYRARHLDEVGGFDPSGWTCWFVVTPVELPRPIPDPVPILPTWAATFSEDQVAEEGTLTITSDDPQCRIVSVETQIDTLGWQTEVADTVLAGVQVWSRTIDLTTDPTVLWYRITYYDAAGNLKVFTSSEGFDLGTTPDILSILPLYNASARTLKAFLKGDVDTKSFAVRAGEGQVSATYLNDPANRFPLGDVYVVPGGGLVDNSVITDTLLVVPTTATTDDWYICASGYSAADAAGEQGPAACVPVFIDSDNRFIDFGFTQDGSAVVFGWLVGPRVAQVWVRIITVPFPHTQGNPEETVRQTSPTKIADPRTNNTFTIPRPAEGYVTYALFETRDANDIPGDVRKARIFANLTEGGPIRFSEGGDGVTCTILMEAQSESGATVTQVRVRDIVAATMSPWRSPDRGPGDVRTVDAAAAGQLLIEGQYEEDITRHQSRETTVRWEVTFSDGTVETRDVICGRNTQPDLLVFEFGGLNGRNPIIQGDTDTQSIRVFDAETGGTNYDEARDGFQATLPEVPDPGTGVVDIYTFQARSDPVAEVDGSTYIDARNVALSGGGAVGAQWERDGSGVVTGVSVTAPTVGSRSILIDLDSDAVANNVEVHMTFRFEGAKGPDSVITSSLTPAVNETNIEAGATYTYQTPWTRVSSGGSLVEIWITAEIEDAGGIVRDSWTVKVSYNGTLA